MRFTHSRGQALYETTIAMPLFLIGLFGVIWAMKDATLSERVQLATRYGGMVSALHEPYLTFSIYSMYATIDDQKLTAQPGCGDEIGQLTSNAAFWQPTTATVTTACPVSLSLIGTNGAETYSQSILLRNNYTAINAQTLVNGFISNAALHGSTTTTVRAAQNFFSSPDVASLLTCTTLGTPIKNSLEGESDTTTVTSANLATPMPTTVTANSVIPAGETSACDPEVNTPTYGAPSAPYN